MATRKRLVASLKGMSNLRRVVSGGQVGADVAGLRAAKRAGIETGGFIPLGFLTIHGMKPELGTEFGLVETTDKQYRTRTEKNAAHSDGTLRFAYNWLSPGEKGTLRAVYALGRPHFDVTPSQPAKPRIIARWIIEQNIAVLNVTGNADEQIETFVESYLAEVFRILGFPA